MVRFDEIRQSIRIVQQAVKQIPEGPVMSVKADVPGARSPG